MPKIKFSWRWVFFAGFLALFLSGASINNLYIDWIWFSQVGFISILQKIIGWKIAIGFLVGIIFFIVLAIQSAIPKRFGSQKVFFLMEDLFEIRDVAQFEPIVRVAIWGVIAFLSFFAGVGASQFWPVPLQALHATSFGATDVIFGRDIGFYVFQLPFLQWMTQLGLSLVFLSAVLTALLSFYYGLIKVGPRGLSIDFPAQVHFSILGGFAMLLVALGYRWSQFDLLRSSHELITGANFTDIHARLPVYGILIGITVIVAILLFAAPFVRRMQLAVTGLIVWFAVVVVGLGLYPEVLQRLTVLPNELKKETPYMERHIEATRQAYGLDQVKVVEFSVSEGITSTDIQQNPGTIRNVRLWDHRPLRETYKQLQEIRTYYDFVDVDIDRYMLDGKYTQVMLSPRELSTARLPSRNWINEHFVFTHGYGLVMSPVNIIGQGGLPHLTLKDIPPVGPKELTLTRPEIYYGEMTSSYAFVNTAQEEFDYPSGDQNVYASYAGTGGIPVNNVFRKGALAWNLGSAKIILSQDIKPESRVMLYRNVRERAEKIAPFLSYDPDPYIVTFNGKLYWILDAYTRTDHYPYSIETRGIGNYIRNSVKVVVDAYNGNVQYFVSDPTDPIIQTYAKIFPGVFQPLDAMPEGLRTHLRYPEGLFRIQTHIYKTYHMETAEVFYNKEDLWQIAKERYQDETLDVQPYYNIMRLPGEGREEFILMIPYTPARKDNMIAWFSARCDGEKYGELLVYKFPKQQLVYGPFQIEARIDQEAEISKQLSLWSQRGSNVIRGNLIVIPIGKSILYVEPLYLQAETGKLPEMKRVIVASGDRIAMENDFPQALQAIFRERIRVATGQTGPDAENVRSENLAGAALEAYRQAEQSRKEGDWAGFGRALNRLETILRQLAQ